MQVPGLGIEPLGAALEAFGYTLRDFYTFPRTHLLAAWFAPPKDLYEVLPRMFVSQLQVRGCTCSAVSVSCTTLRGPFAAGCRTLTRCRGSPQPPEAPLQVLIDMLFVSRRTSGVGPTTSEACTPHVTL